MILSVKNGTFQYRSGETLLNDVSFDAGPGDLIAVLGPNGSGKTTLLRCIMGFLKWKSGESLLDGRNIETFSNRELWQNISYVPQGKGTTVSCTVEEMILLGSASRYGIFGRPDRKDEERAEELMEKMGLAESAHRKCSELSGGQLQMTLIARALQSDPKVLILDEPESNLDFRNQLIVLTTMKKLAGQGKTCIFNTHFPAHAARHANKSILLLRKGQFLFGETRQVITEENISGAFGVKVTIGDVMSGEQKIPYVMPVEVIRNEEQ